MWHTLEQMLVRSAELPCGPYGRSAVQEQQERAVFRVYALVTLYRRGAGAPRSSRSYSCSH